MQTVKFTSVSKSKTGASYQGYTATGDRIHIASRMIEALNLAEGEAIPQLFALVGTKSFNELDPTTKQPTDKTFTRTQALSVFLTKEEMFAAKNDSRLLDDECEAHYKKQASSLGLSVATASALENAAV